MQRLHRVLHACCKGAGRRDHSAGVVGTTLPLHTTASTETIPIYRKTDTSFAEYPSAARTWPIPQIDSALHAWTPGDLPLRVRSQLIGFAYVEHSGRRQFSRRACRARRKADLAHPIRHRNRKSASSIGNLTSRPDNDHRNGTPELQGIGPLFETCADDSARPGEAGVVAQPRRAR